MWEGFKKSSKIVWKKFSKNAEKIEKIVVNIGAAKEILTTVARGKFLKAINIDINAIKPAKHLFKCNNGRLVL